MKFICAWDNVACMVQHVTVDLTMPVGVAIAFVLAIAIATVMKGL